MADLIPGGVVFTGNVSALDSYIDGATQRFVHVENGTELVFTTVEGFEFHRYDTARLGFAFLFNLTVQVSRRDRRVCATVIGFNGDAPSGGVRALRTIKTVLVADPPAPFEE